MQTPHVSQGACIWCSCAASPRTARPNSRGPVPLIARTLCVLCVSVVKLRPHHCAWTCGRMYSSYTAGTSLHGLVVQRPAATPRRHCRAPAPRSSLRGWRKSPHRTSGSSAARAVSAWPRAAERPQARDGFEADVVRHSGERLPLVEQLTLAVEVPVIVWGKHRVFAGVCRSACRSRAARAQESRPASPRLGEHRSAGFRRNMLKMIWMLWTLGMPHRVERLSARSRR